MFIVADYAALRRINQVLKSGIYSTFIVVIVTKMAAKMGLK